MNTAECAGSQLALRILGPVEVHRADKLLVPRRRMSRTLLGMFALRPNRWLSMEWIVDLLWSDGPPPSGAANIRSHVTELRRVLAPAMPDGPRIESAKGRYRLVADPTGLDALRFVAYADDGRRDLAAGRYAAAAEKLTMAGALWRGPILDGTPLPGEAATAAAMLEDRRIDAIEDWVEARLALGQHAELTVELRGLTSTHGMRERLWAQRMVALHRCGRAAEALTVYRDLTELLDAELGIRPGPPVQALHRRILDSACR
jgi:DNA-binding SARP family transcriptional activator